MDYDLVMGLIFVVIMVIPIVAILPRAGLKERVWGRHPKAFALRSGNVHFFDDETDDPHDR